jgi:hypothetical protein
VREDWVATDEGDEDRPATTNRPSAESILADLVELRQHRGVSIPRIEQAGNTLRQMLATDDELERTGGDETLRSAAAYRVIDCGTKTDFVRQDFRQIVRRTLNLDGDEPSLQERQGWLRTALSLSARQYDPLQSEAYRHFAMLLAAVEVSPCRLNPVLPRSVEVSEVNEFNIKLSFSGLDLRELLRQLTLESRIAIREQIFEAIALQLPNGIKAARRALPEHESTSQVTDFLIDSFLRGGYDRRALPMRELRDLGTIVTISRYPPFRFIPGVRSVRNLIRASFVSDYLTWKEPDLGSLLSGRSRPRTWSPIADLPDNLLGAEFWSSRDGVRIRSRIDSRSLDALAGDLLEHEDRNDWDWILDRAAKRRSRAGGA